ncbi:hypothetical protein LEL_04752 [Akanthomyces lecanii RCEF 1005]|uniref:Uncharacterized protein n=1 Tax=Akanthomyces lecanii RCEF 1005 TaxID=1081108 RepID=A0A168HL88_CORDF|nr:hypothetical protein LEL_04752 [Akanthomyces lecanii RCEF 1005]
MPFRRSTKSVISSPELQPRHDVPSPFDLTYSDFTNFVPSQSAPASRRQSITSPCESAYPRVDDPEDGPVLWKVAPPRLSPMEFARSRLIQAALERREGNSMSTGLTKLWFWTPRWESFLMLPRKPNASDPVAPSEVHSSAETLSLETNEDLIMLPESNGQAQVETDRRSFLSCPRLSLNLGNLAVQFPSMLNLMALDAIHPFKSLSSSTKSGSSPDSGESSRATKRSSIYAEQTETTRILFPLGRGSQNQTIDQDFSFPFPALHSIDRHNFQDGSSSHPAMQIADNPFRDTAVYNGVQTTEANPSASSWEERSGRAPTERCHSVERNPPVAGAPRNVGLFPSSSAIAQRLHRRARAVGGHHQQTVTVTPVGARKVGKLVVAGAAGVGGAGSVMSLHAQSEDFALPDASDEERELRPPPLHVVRQRTSTAGGLRERDTTRRNLFRSSNDDGEDDWHGLLRHLGDVASASSSAAAAALENEERQRPAPWSPLYAGRQPETPSTRRQSSVLSNLSMTPTALESTGSPRLSQRAQAEEERSGLSPRQRKVASTYQPLPDSPTLPIVGPQFRIRRFSRRASHGSI